MLLLDWFVTISAVLATVFWLSFLYHNHTPNADTMSTFRGFAIMRRAAKVAVINSP